MGKIARFLAEVVVELTLMIVITIVLGIVGSYL